MKAYHCTNCGFLWRDGDQDCPNCGGDLYPVEEISKADYLAVNRGEILFEECQSRVY